MTAGLVSLISLITITNKSRLPRPA